MVQPQGQLLSPVDSRAKSTFTLFLDDLDSHDDRNRDFRNTRSLCVHVEEKGATSETHQNEAGCWWAKDSKLYEKSEW